jgi:cytochrome b561
MLKTSTTKPLSLAEKLDQKKLMRYGLLAIVFHWVMAIAIVFSFFLGLRMVGLTFSPAKLQLYSVHKWIGISIFFLGVLRILWRLRHAAPPPINSAVAWQNGIASAVHAALYVLMFAVPLIGWLYSSASGVATVFLGISAFQIPNVIEKNIALAAQLKFTHIVLSYSMAVLIAVHISAAVKHHFWSKDGLLNRMWPS